MSERVKSLRKNMTTTLKFIYVAIQFLFFFLIAKEVDAQIDCTTSDDCPKIPNLFPMIFRCINHRCIIGPVIPIKKPR
uniref:Nodule-specific cysteine-rich peptide L20 n=1 Tax=Lens culinaris TaxID=3864 RepID=A0A7T8DV79_LENCU|nr:nodule-specific cysteine-rich peptide L20 [Lens culinaris]